MNPSADPATRGREAEQPAGAVCGCTTCGDVAEPMRVLKIDAARELALCEDEAGAQRTVEIALVEGVADGDELLVHAGTAIAGLGTPPTAPGRESRTQSPRLSRGQFVRAEAEEAAA
jgi:hydrogenase maturation factor